MPRILRRGAHRYETENREEDEDAQLQRTQRTAIRSPDRRRVAAAKTRIPAAT
jgi:hypothetical protein